MYLFTVTCLRVCRLARKRLSPSPSNRCCLGVREIDMINGVGIQASHTLLKHQYLHYLYAHHVYVLYFASELYCICCIEVHKICKPDICAYSTHAHVRMIIALQEEKF